MNRKIMTNQQLGQLAYNTCMWSETVMMQWSRFIDSFENQQGSLPWDNENNCCFLAEKMFLITALNHAVVDLERMNWELMQREDESFESVLNRIASVDERQKIIDLRNMNEHDIDYMTGNGRKQEKFISNYSNEKINLETNAFISFFHGDIPVFLIGGIEIDILIGRFKENMLDIKKKTQAVFDYYYGRDDN